MIGTFYISNSRFIINYRSFGYAPIIAVIYPLCTEIVFWFAIFYSVPYDDVSLEITACNQTKNCTFVSEQLQNDLICKLSNFIPLTYPASVKWYLNSTEFPSVPEVFKNKDGTSTAVNVLENVSEPGTFVCIATFPTIDGLRNRTAYIALDFQNNPEYTGIASFICVPF